VSVARSRLERCTAVTMCEVRKTSRKDSRPSDGSWGSWMGKVASAAPSTGSSYGGSGSCGTRSSRSSGRTPLRTSKRDNFEKFARIIELMELRRHLTVPGVVEIAEITRTMNHRKPSEVLRILRDHTPALFPVPSGRG